MKKALRAALWSPKYRDMLNYFKNGLVWTEIDCEMRKKSKKYANIITNLQYLQFMKEVAGRTSTSGGPHTARGPRVWDRCCKQSVNGCTFCFLMTVFFDRKILKTNIFTKKTYVPQCDHFGPDLGPRHTQYFCTQYFCTQYWDKKKLQ